MQRASARSRGSAAMPAGRLTPGSLQRRQSARHSCHWPRGRCTTTGPLSRKRPGSRRGRGRQLEQQGGSCVQEGASGGALRGRPSAASRGPPLLPLISRTWQASSVRLTCQVAVAGSSLTSCLGWRDGQARGEVRRGGGPGPGIVPSPRATPLNAQHGHHRTSRLRVRAVSLPLASTPLTPWGRGRGAG